MNLYLLRHAIAVAHGAPGYAEDSERPLTPEGAEKMRQIAAGMKRLDLEFDVWLSSPYVRAWQTAEIVARVFKATKKLDRCDALADVGDPKALARHLLQHHAAAESILVVGHEPHLSSVASLLLIGTYKLPMNLKKGGLCALAVDHLRVGPCAELQWLLAPRQLVRLAQAGK